jgi:FAD/FMN-containing dehydrogenase
MHLLACFALFLAAPTTAAIVNDVTQLNPIEVDRIVAPKTIEEVQTLVQNHHGPISIGGGRFSMGGQTATEGTLQIDMRGLNKMLSFSPEDRSITMQAGATWRNIQEIIDPHDLSIKIMQSYANFTLGGSISVNAHGRYVNQGPLIRSLKEIRVVLANGKLINASRTQHADIFHAAVGGYGAVGVIVAATIDLEPNEPLELDIVRMPVGKYLEWFKENIRGSTSAVFHNADIYTPGYEDVIALTYSRTDRAPTEERRLQNWDRRHIVERISWLWMSEAPGGKKHRKKIIDPLRLKSDRVVWRNFEASYDVKELEPRTRKLSTYVLREYFVPVERFDEFLPKMAEIFKRYDANIMNVSIRHALKDTGSYMAWAPKECFAFVVYYKQGVDRAAREKVGLWTREVIDEVLKVDGTYYLPYQIFARDAQFRQAYPGHKKLFALKRRVDPTYKFRNKLWDRYLPPPEPIAENKEIRAKLAKRKNYQRPGDQTYLTLPEWFIVFSADEYAAHLKTGRPSAFPFFGSIRQFWSMYSSMRKSVAKSHRFNWGYNVMIVVIGLSQTAEYTVKGLYEKTFGRAFEFLSRGKKPGVDRYEAATAAEYSAFIHHTPWYAFPFGKKLKGFWSAPAGPGILRPLERRVFYSAELLTKTIWGWLMGKATGAAYDAEDAVIYAWVQQGRGTPEKTAEGVKTVEQLAPGQVLISIPRYEPFTQAVQKLSAADYRFVEIAGNQRILLTVTAPAAYDRARLWGEVEAEWPILSVPGHQRIALSVAVGRLHQALAGLKGDRVTIEHVYDF